MRKTSVDMPEFVGEDNGPSSRSRDTSEDVRERRLGEGPHIAVRAADVKWTPTESLFAV